MLRRGLSGQSGSQWFFTEAGRPFTLYVVLGSHIQRSRLVPRVNDLIGTLSIDPNATPSAPTPPAALTHPPLPPAGAPWN